MNAIAGIEGSFRFGCVRRLEIPCSIVLGKGLYVLVLRILYGCCFMIYEGFIQVDHRP